MRTLGTEARNRLTCSMPVVDRPTMYRIWFQGSKIRWHCPGTGERSGVDEAHYLLSTEDRGWAAPTDHGIVASLAGNDAQIHGKPMVADM